MLPGGDGLGAEFYERAAATGALHLQRCDACATWRHPPRIRCAACGSDAWSWQPAAGTGRIFTWTVTHRATDPGVRRRAAVRDRRASSSTRARGWWATSWASRRRSSGSTSRCGCASTGAPTPSRSSTSNPPDRRLPLEPTRRSAELPTLLRANSGGIGPGGSGRGRARGRSGGRRARRRGCGPRPRRSRRRARRWSRRVKSSLAATSRSSGPSCSVRRWMIRRTSGPRRDRGRGSRASTSRPARLADEQASSSRPRARPRSRRAAGRSRCCRSRRSGSRR